MSDTAPAAQTNATSTGDTLSAKDFDLEAFIPYRLSLLSNTISEGIAAAYRSDFGLSVTEWRVLAILGRFPGVTASEVMTRGAMDKVAVSRAVARLGDKGLLQRSERAQDRRSAALSLTRKGIRQFNTVVPRALSYEARLIEALEPEEQAQLKRLLDTLQRRAAEMSDAE